MGDSFRSRIYCSQNHATQYRENANMRIGGLASLSTICHLFYVMSRDNYPNCYTQFERDFGFTEERNSGNGTELPGLSRLRRCHFSFGTLVPSPCKDRR